MVEASWASGESAILCAGREKGRSAILWTVGINMQALWNRQDVRASAVEEIIALRSVGFEM